MKFIFFFFNYFLKINNFYFFLTQGIRSHKANEQKYITTCLQEIKTELASTDMPVRKAKWLLEKNLIKIFMFKNEFFFFFSFFFFQI